ncbi:hypothetical protein [Ornithinimicrobium cavernae]|uniref:hypothetical protein n=1 Tax=Ornithinimicrobium cavernae TaxID=2666047 RepID=UPI000D69FFBA|nr:hypothetical protein [Ornithinimicrobium cavernae]
MTDDDKFEQDVEALVDKLSRFQADVEARAYELRVEHEARRRIEADRDAADRAAIAVRIDCEVADAVFRLSYEYFSTFADEVAEFTGLHVVRVRQSFERLRRKGVIRQEATYESGVPGLRHDTRGPKPNDGETLWTPTYEVTARSACDD